MANNFKRSIAMLLVLNMLTGMIPVQALADEGAPSIEVSASSSESSSSSSSESSSSSSSSSSSESSSSSSSSGSSESSSSSGSSGSSESSSSSSSESSSSGSSESSSSGSSDSSSSGSSESSSSSSSESSSSDSSDSSSSGSSESSSSSEAAVAFTLARPSSENSEGGNTEGNTEGGSDEGNTEGGEPAPTSMEEPKFESQLTTEGGDIEVTKGEIEKTETTDGDGNTVTTTSQTTTTQGTIEIEGGTATIEGKETYTETITTTPEGEEIGSYWEIDGSEKAEWDVEDTGDTPGQLDVTVDIIPGETTTGTAQTVTGDVKEGEDDQEYDYTITTDRTVTVEASEIQSTVSDSDSELVKDQENTLESYNPVYDVIDDETEDKEGVFDDLYNSSVQLDYINVNGISIWVSAGNGVITDMVIPEGCELPADHALLKNASIGAKVSSWYNKDGTLNLSKFPEDIVYKSKVDVVGTDDWRDEDGNPVVTVPEDGEYRFVGIGEYSKYYVASEHIYYEKDEVTGETLRDENGIPIIKAIKTEAGTVVKVNGVPATELVDGDLYSSLNGRETGIFMLEDKEGNKVYTYCVEMGVKATAGAYYSVSNLEDSDYYASEESEEHIRTIVLNGYWGTSDVPKSDGSYEAGSLESIKQKLKEAIANGDMPAEFEVQLHTQAGKADVDENGNIKTQKMNMLDIIDNLTEGEALLATQAAIWSYSNGHQNALNGEDGVVVVDAVSRGNFNASKEWFEGEAMDDQGCARAEFLYSWLMSLETEEQSTIVINDKNFVDDMSITVHDKVADHESNKDDFRDNDVYETDLNFTLAFIPGEKDDLLVQITYGAEGEEKKTVVKRLAGKNDDDESYEDVVYNEEDGSYVIQGLQLSENQNWGFNLRLEGTQYLENGVYIYKGAGHYESSQTMVGVAEGERNVDVSVGMTIKFDVDENNHVVAERRWHSEKDPRIPGDNPPPPARYRLTRGVGQLEIIDEEVPLAEPPQTGDISVLWFAMVAMSGLGLCLMNLLEKKRQQA